MSNKIQNPNVSKRIKLWTVLRPFGKLRIFTKLRINSQLVERRTKKLPRKHEKGKSRNKYLFPIELIQLSGFRNFVVSWLFVLNFGICHLTFIWHLDFDIGHLNSFYSVTWILLEMVVNLILWNRVRTFKHYRYDDRSANKTIWDRRFSPCTFIEPLDAKRSLVG